MEQPLNVSYSASSQLGPSDVLTFSQSLSNKLLETLLSCLKISLLVE